MSDGFQFSEFLSGFLAEAGDLLAVSSKSLLAMDETARGGRPNARAVREAFRALHTIKGLSAMVGIEPIVAIAHRMESALRGADREGKKLSAEVVEALLEGHKAIEQRVRLLAEGKVPPEAPARLLALLEGGEEGPRAPGSAGTPVFDPRVAAKLSAADQEQLAEARAAGRQLVRADFTPTPARAARGLNITSVREQLKEHVDLVKVLPLAVPRTDETPGALSFALLFTAPPELDVAALAARLELQLAPLAQVVEVPAENLPEAPPDDEGELVPQAARLVRVEVGRLDDAMERLSALIVTRFRLAKAVVDLQQRGADVRELQQIVAENARQLRDLRSAVLQIRMVPAAEMLERVPLLVRGLKQSTGKRARLEIDAGKAEVDKAVAERLFPAVVHLVRNAVDHALESPDERKQLGKPEEGLLRIVCFERGGNQLELSVTDDGRGVDRKRVAARAGREEPQTDAALLELLCLPGLSTREQATTTSGRGMGMDIVKRIAVDELGGELLLETRPGAGSTFTLRVPLTVTIVDAFSFLAARTRYVVPVALVEEIVEIEPGQLIRGPSRKPGAPAQVGMLQRRGKALPLLRLDAIFGGASALEPPEPTKAIVVRRSGQPVGFSVHRMLGQQEVVVRPLDDRLVRVPGVSGATDLGDGKPTLVLDLVALAASTLQKSARGTA